MSENTIEQETPIIFLAMFWGGGGPYTISQIVHVYDWINRGTPSREDLELALNTLLSLKLITLQDGKFSVPRNVGKDFDIFRKKKRKSKFTTVRMYFEQFNPPTDLPNFIELSEEIYTSELKKYRKYMES